MSTSAGKYDAIIVGAGPAGAVCAAVLATAGRRVLLLDRARFPRDKVCGDCLNPAVWPIIDRLGLRERLLALPHTAVREISYHGIGGTDIRFRMSHASEIVVKRRDLDALLVARAVEAGAEFQDGVSVSRIAPGWEVGTDSGIFHASVVIAADGRNSAVARLAGRLPAAARERIAIQCHCPRPAWHGDAVRMMFYPGGYGGTARPGGEDINLCLVAAPDRLAQVQAMATCEFDLPPDTEWRTVSPLARADASDIASDGLFLIGDAARVVEPFTGEGIYYAMRSGELAAEALVSADNAAEAYRRAHREMYRGRLWINRLARLAGRHPWVTSRALKVMQLWSAPLRILTEYVVGRTGESASASIGMPRAVARGRS
jgi:geranylgeranyl reductase family protein